MRLAREGVEKARVRAFRSPDFRKGAEILGPEHFTPVRISALAHKNENDHLPEQYPLYCFDDSHAYVGIRERLRTHLHAEGEVESAAVQEASSNFGAGDILVDEFLGQVAGYVCNRGLNHAQGQDPFRCILPCPRRQATQIHVG